MNNSTHLHKPPEPEESPFGRLRTVQIARRSLQDYFAPVSMAWSAVKIAVHLITRRTSTTSVNKRPKP
jgi:hypothetical protein